MRVAGVTLLLRSSRVAALVRGLLVEAWRMLRSHTESWWLLECWSNVLRWLVGNHQYWVRLTVVKIVVVVVVVHNRSSR